MKKFTTSYQLLLAFLSPVLFASHSAGLRAKEYQPAGKTLAPYACAGAKAAKPVRAGTRNAGTPGVQKGTGWYGPAQTEPAVAPDLLVAATPRLAPTRLVAGSPAVVQTTIQNAGLMRAGFSVLGYYLSADATLSSDDLLLGETVTTALAANNSLTSSSEITVPASTAAGAYYLLRVADYLNLVRESNDGNNVWAHRVAVAAAGGSAALSGQPDPLATTPTPPPAAEPRAAFSLSVAPNPVAHAAPLRVQLSGPGLSAGLRLALYNSQGQQVATQALASAPGGGGQAEFSTGGLAAGVYVLHLTGTGLHAAQRVIIE